MAELRFPVKVTWVNGKISKIQFTNEAEPVKHFHDADDFLAHYGIKGMKWGKRKAFKMPVEGGKDKAHKKGGTPEEEIAKAKRKKAIQTGTHGALAVGGLAVLYGKPLANLALDAAGSAAVRRAAARGAKASAPVMKEIGNQLVVTLSKKSNGSWG
jgi:hypothetical protein